MLGILIIIIVVISMIYDSFKIESVTNRLKRIKPFTDEDHALEEKERIDFITAKYPDRDKYLKIWEEGKEKRKRPLKTRYIEWCLENNEPSQW